ncbi:MAG: hypothetical protein ACTSQ8_22630 [Candidatus Helarchaeota archaeon]
MCRRLNLKECPMGALQSPKQDLSRGHHERWSRTWDGDERGGCGVDTATELHGGRCVRNDGCDTATFYDASGDLMDTNEQMCLKT